jgi:hypothetical protein
MIVAGSASPLLLASAAGGYNLTNSLRFRSSASAYLNRTFTTPTDNKKWTLSTWVKIGSYPSGENIVLFAVAPDGNNRAQLQFGGSGVLAFDQINAGNFDGITSTVAVYRDPSAWYHVVFVFDSANATASLRNRYYINGVEQAYNNSVTIPQNTASKINSAITHQIGKNPQNDFFYFSGYQTEINFIDGQALTPSSFGEFSSKTGVWQPIEYAGTYGTNGFYLPFTDNSALTTSSNVGLGKDFSGNGNYWTTNNISITAGSTYDSMTDVPTLTSETASNFPTWNPLDKATDITYSDANLYAVTTGSTDPANITSTMAFPPTGKWYFEITAIVGGSQPLFGIGSNNPNSFATYRTTGTYNTSGMGGTTSGSGATFTTGDVIGVAYDASAGSLSFYKNGTAQSGGITGITPANYYTAVVRKDSGSGDGGTINFGQRPFAYTPPTGFVALNTFNLPTPTIGATASTQAGKYFNPVLYTGNGSAGQTISGVGFQPDFIWLKSRSNAEDNNVYDTVRGISSGGSPTLLTNSNAVEATYSGFGVSAVNSDGFSLIGDGSFSNRNGYTYVAWNWKANGTGVSNTAGSITSTVSANTSAGFSVVTYTGTGANATVGHGLGVAPKMVIVKRRDTVDDWFVYNQNIGNTNYLRLNSNVGSATFNFWQNTNPTSSVFSISSDVSVNASGSTYVAYCFSEIASYSSIGSYTGNGSSDGTFVYTGFKPRYILIKRSSTGSGDWCIYDTAINTYNLSQSILRAQNSGGQIDSDTLGIDILSNGFKLRFNNTDINSSGLTYTYLAFAESPFKYANAR